MLFLTALLLIIITEAVSPAPNAPNSNNLAFTYAVMMNQVYEQKTDNACSFQLDQMFQSSNQKQSAYVFSNDNYRVFAIPGIDQKGDREIAFDFELVPLFRDISGISTDAQVHKGFYSWAMEIEPLILQYQDDDSRSIVIVGHSAGGASAYILTAHMIGIYPWFRERLAEVYTYGAPKPGNSDFRDFWREILPFGVQDSRYVMFRQGILGRRTDDPITILPPFPFRHVVDPIDIRCQTTKDGSCDLFQLHHMTLYQFSLEKDGGICV